MHPRRQRVGKRETIEHELTSAARELIPTINILPSSSFFSFWTIFADGRADDDENGARCRRTVNGGTFALQAGCARRALLEVCRGGVFIAGCREAGASEDAEKWFNADRDVENEREQRGTSDSRRVADESTGRDMMCVISNAVCFV